MLACFKKFSRTLFQALGLQIYWKKTLSQAIIFQNNCSIHSSIFQFPQKNSLDHILFVYLIRVLFFARKSLILLNLFPLCLIILIDYIVETSLIHCMQLVSLYIPSKIARRFANVLKGFRKRLVAWNGL